MQKNVEKIYICRNALKLLRKSCEFIQRQFGAQKSCMWRDAAAKIMGIYTTSEKLNFSERELFLVDDDDRRSCFGLMTSIKCEWEVEVPKKSGLDKIRRKILVSSSPNVR